MSQPQFLSRENHRKSSHIHSLLQWEPEILAYPFSWDPMGRMNREWFQGGFCGTKLQAWPASLIFEQMPWNQLHSATFSLQKERKTQVLLGFRLPSQLRTCTTTLLVTCPSDALIPAAGPSVTAIPASQEPEGHRHPHPQHTAVGTGPVAHQLSLHVYRVSSVPFHPSDPAGGTCPNTKIKTIVQSSRGHHCRGHHMGQRTQEPQADGSSSHGAQSSQGPHWDPSSESHSTPSPPLLLLWEQDAGNS